MGEGLELPWVGGLCPELGLWPPFCHPNLSESGREGAVTRACLPWLSTSSPAPRAQIVVTFPVKCLVIFRSDSRRICSSAPSAAFPFPGLKALSALQAGDGARGRGQGS